MSLGGRRETVWPEAFEWAGLSAAAAAACVEFARVPGVANLATRKGARGKCFLVSSDFALWLRVAGIDYRWLRACGPRILTYLEPQELDHRAQVVQNATLVEETAVVDWTWRMWQPDFPTFPRITKLVDWLTDFDRLDTDLCELCGRSIISDTHEHMPREEAAVAAQHLRAGQIQLGGSALYGMREKADRIVEELFTSGENSGSSLDDVLSDLVARGYRW